MKFIAFTLMVFFFATSIAHSKTVQPDFCIRNETDYNTYRSQLPSFLQPMPSFLGGDGKVALVVKVVAAIKLSFQNGVMVFTSDVWKPGGRFTDRMEISSACFFKAAKKIRMQFSNGVVSDSKYTNTQLVQQGFPLQRVTQAAHQALIAKIAGNNSGRPGRPSAVGVRN